MTTKELRAPASGPLTVSLRAGMAYAEIIASAGVTTATAEISGPQDVIDGTRERMSGGAWEIVLPDDATGGTMIVSSRGGRTVIRGNVTSGVVIGGGSRGTVIQSAGRVVVNGVDVTDVVSSRSGGDTGPVRVTVRLPAGSSLETDIGTGHVRCRGPLAAITAESLSADLEAEEAAGIRAHSTSGDIRVGHLTGQAALSATSGDITVIDAAGTVDAHATSGDIAIHCTAPVAVSAYATSGDVRVTAARGVQPRVRARSVSGDVRTPEGRR